MSDRFLKPVNTSQYSRANRPKPVCFISDWCAPTSQMILRMLVESPYSRGLQLPPELLWLSDVVNVAKTHQNEVIGVRHPFIYVTVRSGPVTSVTDDDWHVDGFSTRYTHLPEANYIVVLRGKPTQFLKQTFNIPAEFDPLVHNIHTYFQAHADPSCVCDLEKNVLCFLDPYVVHRRPPETTGEDRCMVRISFTPIEIPDKNNTPNPLVPTPHYITDGVKEFRDKLIPWS